MHRTVLQSGRARIAAAFLMLGSSAAFAASGTLHSFRTYSAQSPRTALVRDAAGNLYGTTIAGGGDCNIPGGCGTVFKLISNGAGDYTFSILYDFKGWPSDGTAPDSTLILDTSGNLFGTTTSGGPSDGGVVFELSPGSSGAYSYQILYSFQNYTCFVLPLGRLYMDRFGNLFGVTEEGGADCSGSVFELSPGPSGWSEEALYSFTGGIDGRMPAGGLIVDSAGNFYGSATEGGANGTGVIYKLAPPRGTPGRKRFSTLSQVAATERLPSAN